MSKASLDFTICNSEYVKLPQNIKNIFSDVLCKLCLNWPKACIHLCIQHQKHACMRVHHTLHNMTKYVQLICAIQTQI